jgi:hypothetical protein
MKAHSTAYRAAVHPDNAHWTQLRWARYRQQGGRCAVCGLKLGLRYDAHHVSYRNLGRETIFDIRIVHHWPCHPLADIWRRQAGRFERWFWSFYR